MHNPEFTMVEWYRVGDDYAAGMQLLADLAEAIFVRQVRALRLSYREAFQRHAGIDPFGSPERNRRFLPACQPMPTAI